MGEGGCGRCLPGRWLAAGWTWKEAACCCPQPPTVPSRILCAPSPVTAQVISIPSVVSLPYHLPPYLLQSFLVLLPSLPCSSTTVACNNFFLYTFPISRLNPAGAIVGSFHVSLLLSSIISSCTIPAHLTQPLSFVQALYCELFKVPAIFLIK